MALANFSLPFGGLTAHHWAATVSPLQPHHVNAVNNLLYGPAGHQNPDEPPEYFKNNPYSIPASHHFNNNNRPLQTNNNYLPPPLPPSATSSVISSSNNHRQSSTFSQLSRGRTSQQQQNGPFQHHNRNNRPLSSQPHHSQSNSNYDSVNQQQSAELLPPLLPPPSSSGSSSSSSRTTFTEQQHPATFNLYHGSIPDDPTQQNYFTDGFATSLTNNQQSNYDLIQQPQSAAAAAAAAAVEAAAVVTLSPTFPPSITPAPSLTQQQQQPTRKVTIPNNSQNTDNNNNNNNYQQLQQTSRNNDQVFTKNIEQQTQAQAQAQRQENNVDSDDLYPGKPPGFTRVQAGQGSKTQVHAVLDYDIEEGEEDDYYDNGDEGTPAIHSGGNTSQMPTVTPIQGPIFLKNGTVPVVPLFSYPTINNGTFVQIPIWWTALSVALGLDIRGDVIRGVPCIKRYHQLFCPTAGNSYPIDKIERFIDDNKALMRRMYGDFEVTNDYGPPTQQNRRRRRYLDDPDLFIPSGHDPFPDNPNDENVDHLAAEAGDSYFNKFRSKRQNLNNKNNQNKNNQNKPPFNRNNGSSRPNSSPNPNDSSTGRVDACESKIEIVTPYWASNSAGKIRAIVNTQHFEQAIHQEICTKVQTSRCGNDCGCEQKYKWHRLLAYDPDNDCKGIFMDWFLFPSCCVCRCNP